MTNTERAHKQAAKQSKTQGAHYVVYVNDEGTQCMNAEQMRVYAPLIHLEATYINGVKVSAVEALSA